MQTEHLFDSEEMERVIQNIESRGHFRHLRYLMTKKYHPRTISLELNRLGLSSPSNEIMFKYYIYKIEPLLRKYKLSFLYSDYSDYARGGKKMPASKDNKPLKFMTAVGVNDSVAKRFCEMVKELEVDGIWSKEIVHFYGGVEHTPKDDDGEIIISTPNIYSGIELILSCEKRYLIDAMLVDRQPLRAVVKFCKEDLKLKLENNDIVGYKKMFFSFSTNETAKSIEVLNAERQCLRQTLATIDTDPDLKDTEKFVMKKQLAQRIDDLQKSIRHLNGQFSDFAVERELSTMEEFSSMFMDVTRSCYRRFKELDKYKDRDVADVLTKVVKMMGYSFEKYESIQKQSKLDTAETGSAAELMNLYQEQVNSYYENQMSKQKALQDFSNEGLHTLAQSEIIDIDSIGGIDELGFVGMNEE